MSTLRNLFVKFFAKIDNFLQTKGIDMNKDRFKFRVWDNAKNQYVDDSEVELLLNSDGGLLFGDWHSDTHFAEGDYIIEQCTGFSDKIGNLIHEGDIVYDSVYRNNFVVSWDDDRTGYDLSANNTNHIDYLSKSLIERHNLKVVGNIHEQKERP